MSILPDTTETHPAGTLRPPLDLSGRNRLKSISHLFSDTNLTKKASLNALASILDYAAQLIVGLVITPLQVSWLGEYFFGAWQVLNRIVGYISPASGRPTLVLKWTLANQQASDDIESKRRSVGSAVAVWLMFFPVVVVVGAILSWFAPYWIKSPPAAVWILRATTAILVFKLAVTGLFAIPNAVLQGNNLGYKRIGLTVLLIFLGGGLTWLALILKTNIIGVASVAVLMTILSGVLFFNITRSLIPWFGVARPSWPDVRNYVSLTGWYLAWDAIFTLMMASDVVMLGLLHTVESVTMYSLTKYAPEMVITMVAIVMVGIAPGLGGILGKKDFRKAAQVRGEIMSITWLIVTAIGATILLWNRPFLSLWVGKQFYPGSLQALLIVIVVAQFVLIRNDATVIDITMNLKRKVLLGAVSVGITLLVIGILISKYQLGIMGASIGLFTGRLVLSLGYPILLGRFLQVPFATQLRSALRPALITVFLFGAAYLVDSSGIIQLPLGLLGWIAFIFLAALSAGLLIMLSFFSGLSRKQRSRLWLRVRAVLVPAARSDKP